MRQNYSEFLASQAVGDFVSRWPGVNGVSASCHVVLTLRTRHCRI